MVVGEANTAGEMPGIPLKDTVEPAVDSDLCDSSDHAIPKVLPESSDFPPVDRAVVVIKVHEPPVQTETRRSATEDGEGVTLAPEEVELGSRPVAVDEAGASSVELSPQERVKALQEKYEGIVTQIRRQVLIDGHASQNTNRLQYKRSALCALRVIDNLLADQLVAFEKRRLREEEPEPKPLNWFMKWIPRIRAKPVIKWAQREDTRKRAQNAKAYWQELDHWYGHLNDSEKVKVAPAKKILDAARIEFYKDFADLLS